MTNQLPIVDLILTRSTELHIKRAEIARRAGYKNVSKGVGRIADLCAGDLSPRTRFLLDALPAALGLTPDVVRAAIDATATELAEQEGARAEEEERRYRAAFKPHVLWTTERDRPTSITMACFAGIDRLLTCKLDIEQGEKTYIAQALTKMPPGIAFFGKTTGFCVNYSPDKCVEFDGQGNVVATFPRARQLGSADVTLKDGRSILPLFGVNPPEPYEQ